MDLTPYLSIPGEKPLDRIVTDGGMVGIFRTVGFIGDSLSSGEFEGTKEDGSKSYHDYYEYSWGQYIARAAGLKAYNFSKGGMTAKQYWESFAESRGFWGEEYLCQAYVIALGVNDVLNKHQNIGTMADINLEDYNKNGDSFVGYYARIIQRLKTMQPKARFFLVTMPHGKYADRDDAICEVAEAIRAMAELFEFTYVIDLEKYAPVYDEEFQRLFYLGGHMNAAGYLLTSRMIASYMDFIIRNNPEDFKQVGFIGTPYHNAHAKW